MEAILSNKTRKLLWFEITKMLITLLKICIVCLLFIIIYLLSFSAYFRPLYCDAAE